MSSLASLALQPGSLMKILSINRGKKQQLVFNNKVFDTGLFKDPIAGSARVGRFGIDDDVIVDRSVHGGPDQAVYLYSAEDYAWWASENGKVLAPGTFGENLTTAGIDLRTLVIGDRLVIGEVELEVTAPRVPCFKLATRMGDPTFVKQFVRAARPGAYARVLHEGELAVGDRIRLEKTTEDFAGLVDVFNAWHAKQPAADVLQKALRSPLGEHHRKRIQALYAAASG